MSLRLACLSLLLLPLMACSPKDAAAPADATTPATPAATEPAATTDASPAADAATTPPATPATGDVPTDAAATPPATPVAAPSGAPLVAGKDYTEIQNGRPFDPKDGKIEVVEVFGFVCPACARFQPQVAAWKAKLPGDVRFTYVPAMFGNTWDDYGRAFYTAQSMGIEEKTHDALYKAIHLDQTLKGERGRDSVEDIANFYAKFGADPKVFASTMASFSVGAKTSKAKQFAMASQITGTPSLVIDGKYLVKGADYDDILRIADQLIAQERAAGQ